MPVTTADEATGTQDIFNKELETYRRVVATNLMFHREVYGLLRDLLVEHAPGSFRFLDVACGDATASAAMLKTTAVGGYVGIDRSEASLRLADRARRAPVPGRAAPRRFRGSDGELVGTRRRDLDRHVAAPPGDRRQGEADAARPQGLGRPGPIRHLGADPVRGRGSRRLARPLLLAAR